MPFSAGPVVGATPALAARSRGHLAPGAPLPSGQPSASSSPWRAALGASAGARFLSGHAATEPRSQAASWARASGRLNSGFSADSDPRVVMEPGRVGGWGRGREGWRFTWGKGPRSPWLRIQRPEPPPPQVPPSFPCGAQTLRTGGARGPSAQPFACPAGQSPLPAAVL